MTLTQLQDRLIIAWRALIGKSDAGFQMAIFNAVDVLGRQPDEIDCGRVYNLSNPQDWNAVCSQRNPTGRAVAARLQLQEENRKCAGLPLHQMGFLERAGWIARRRWSIIRRAFNGEYDYLWENKAANAHIEKKF